MGLAVVLLPSLPNSQIINKQTMKLLARSLARDVLRLTQKIHPRRDFPGSRALTTKRDYSEATKKTKHGRARRAAEFWESAFGPAVLGMLQRVDKRWRRVPAERQSLFWVSRAAPPLSSHALLLGHGKPRRAGCVSHPGLNLGSETPALPSRGDSVREMSSW